MNRTQSIDAIDTYDGYWDMLVIGGGATGLGCALDAASRGYKTLLVEQHDFAKGTSSRSTKLVHGGVRYLQQGNISLVLEALHERGLLMQNAPHLVQNQAFIVPNYEWWDGPFYGVGLKVYDLLAGRLGLGPSKWLSKAETLQRIPTLEPDQLRGGVIYYDGQFDDARLAVNLAQSIADAGGVPVNYMQVTGLTYSGQMIDGVKLTDTLNGDERNVHARVVVNATGIFTDDILRMDRPAATPIITHSQGVHLVLDKRFLKGNTAIMVPQTEDGRVLFAVPWHDRVLVGTTDTPVDQASLEPRPPRRRDRFYSQACRPVYGGGSHPGGHPVCVCRAEAAGGGGEGKKTATISRDHHLAVSQSGLVTITGGKWTTYRKMAEDTVDQAALIAGLPESECPTRKLRIHGWLKNMDPADPLCAYGSDAVFIRRIIDADPGMGEKLHDNLPYTKAEVVWAVRHEMALTAGRCAGPPNPLPDPGCGGQHGHCRNAAHLMAQELGRGSGWEKQQVAEFQSAGIKADLPS
jgi:glycerol-3-phosphate dehydrogenase